MLTPHQRQHEHPGYHGVSFYADSTRHARAVADFLARGVAAGEPVVMIATAAHRRAITKALLKRRLPVDTLVGTAGITLLDADESLGRFMVNDVPDAPRFRRVIGAVLERVSGRQSQPVRAYGEMVDVLWGQGKYEAAVQLELLWNELATTYRFALLCGYATQLVPEGTSRHMLRSLHSCEHA